MQLVDTHAHLYLDRFDEDREDVIRRAADAGVTDIVLPAIDVPSIHAALALAARHRGIHVMAALHPSETKDATDADWLEVETLSREPAVVAIGETGLDYHWDRSFDERQREFLRRHIALAEERDLPLVFHDRKASEDLVRIAGEAREASSRPERLRGVFHCFGGPAELAVRVLGLGFHVGLGGTLTFRNSGVADAVREVPLGRIVLETDAPFLAPAPNRGRRNEPAWVRLVADRLAEVRAEPVEHVAAVTTANARRLFGLR
jgi:TatD DNase family protein